ncbi:hypothetical protein OK016_00410 [Vibrio chagasii]|nr:hypothetical protein [Vibrio chagasii]
MLEKTLNSVLAKTTYHNRVGNAIRPKQSINSGHNTITGQVIPSQRLDSAAFYSVSLGYKLNDNDYHRFLLLIRKAAPQ